MNPTSHTYDFDPPPQDSRTFAWAGGIFDTAHRTYAAAVEGLIRMPYHLVLVTLQGGARQLESSPIAATAIAARSVPARCRSCRRIASAASGCMTSNSIGHRSL
jgi:hypothetical protein